MQSLILSIFFSTLLVIIFKLFEKFRIGNLHAIVVNYFMASLIGYWLYEGGISLPAVISSPWFLHAVVIGIVFFGLFNIIAYTTQKIGITVASVANKMSLVVPAIAAVFLYGDEMKLLKGVGIALALCGVLLTSLKKESLQIPKNYILFPVIVFIGSGLIDTFFKYTEHYYLPDDEMLLFIPVLFTIAGLSGLIAMAVSCAVRNEKVKMASVAGGILLGIPNYFSVYYLIKTLKVETMQSSVIFPVNNTGIVMLSVLSAWMIFREKISLVNWIGIALSISAVLMIAV